MAEIEPHHAPLSPPAPLSLRHRVVFSLLVVCSIALFMVGAHLYRRTIDRFQYERPRYAAERALEFLDAGEEDQANIEVELLREDRPIYTGLFNLDFDEVMEGRVFRNRVMVFEKLAAALLGHEMFGQAEQVAWKAILEYHSASRAVELPISWELLFHVKAMQQDWSSAFQIARILAAHGWDRIRMPGEIETSSFKVDPSLLSTVAPNLPASMVRGLQLYATAEIAGQFLGAVATLERSLPQTEEPIIQRQIHSMIHRGYERADLTGRARKKYEELWGREPQIMDPFWNPDPSERAKALKTLSYQREPWLLDLMWRDRPAHSPVGITDFLDSFYGDARVGMIDFRSLEPQDLGYFNQKNQFMIGGDYSVLFSQSVAANLKITTDKPIRRIYLAYEATPVLGIYPILLVRIDGRTWIPVYCDPTEPADPDKADEPGQPDLVAIDVDIASDPSLGQATHIFEFVFLNDAGFQMKKVKENRDLRLFRMVLVHVPPNTPQ